MEIWQTAMEFSCAIIECDQLSVIPKLCTGTCLTLNMLDNFHNAKVNVCNKLSYHVIKLKCCHLAASLYEQYLCQNLHSKCPPLAFAQAKSQC